MFLCAIACPCFNPSANSWWDGKLGIWPIGDWEPVKRASKNWPRGTLVWKNKLVTNVLDVVDEASAFDEISIPNTPDIDMEEINLMKTLEGEQTNITNKNMNKMNENTSHTENHT